MIVIVIAILLLLAWLMWRSENYREEWPQKYWPYGTSFGTAITSDWDAGYVGLPDRYPGQRNYYQGMNLNAITAPYWWECR